MKVESYPYSTGAQEEEERKKSEDIFEKITAENSPNLGKETGSGSTRSP